MGRMARVVVTGMTGVLLVMLVCCPVGAQTAPGPVSGAPAAPPVAPLVPALDPSAAQRQYERARKSPALALTLEAICPIAGAGTIYTGTEGDKAGFLAVLSALTAGAGVGAALWFIHLDGEHAGGVSRATLDAEQGAALTVLATAGLVYLVARVSGLSLASDATEAFNEELLRRLAVHPNP
jgi:hypothetical protein